MDWPAALSRAQFEKAARALGSSSASSASDRVELGAHQISQGWEWSEHKVLPGFGYLHKQLDLELANQSSAEVDEEVDVTGVAEQADEGALVDDRGVGDEFVRAKLSICFSPSYSVPVLYFNVYNKSGAPLPLADILSSSFFHRSALPAYPFTTFTSALNPQESQDEPAPPAPFISQAEHPTLSTPSWFLHPCETQTILGEVLGERGEKGEGWEREWLESWLMVVGGVVDLRG